MPEPQQQKIVEKIKCLFKLKLQSKQLLEIAKTGVEQAIETDEATATAWINQQLEALGINLSNSNSSPGDTMSEITLNSDRFKEILKNAIIELLRENRGEVSEFLAEIIEDVAMERAIAEGEATEIVSRESIFQLLEPKR